MLALFPPLRPLTLEANLKNVAQMTVSVDWTWTYSNFM